MERPRVNIRFASSQYLFMNKSRMENAETYLTIEEIGKCCEFHVLDCTLLFNHTSNMIINDVVESTHVRKIKRCKVYEISR